MTQLGKMRDQISGVSIDEETANLMQFQHAFDAIGQSDPGRRRDAERQFWSSERM